MKKLFILLAGTVLISKSFAQTDAPKAKEEHQKKQKAAYYVNVNIDIIYKDKQGNDLLDSTKGTHYSIKDITLYHMEKGEKVKINKPHMDHPNNRFLYRDEATKTNHLRVFLEQETVLIQLNATTTDTIKCKIKKQKGSTIIEKVWYNGELKWEHGRDKSQVITIVK